MEVLLHSFTISAFTYTILEKEPPISIKPEGGLDQAIAWTPSKRVTSLALTGNQTKIPWSKIIQMLLHAVTSVTLSNPIKT